MVGILFVCLVSDFLVWFFFCLLKQYPFSGERAGHAASIPSAGTTTGSVSLPGAARGQTQSQTPISPRSMGISWGVEKSSAHSLRKLSHTAELWQPQPCGKLHCWAPVHRVSPAPSQHREPQRPDGHETQGDAAGCCGGSARPGGEQLWAAKS